MTSLLETVAALHTPLFRYLHEVFVDLGAHPNFYPASLPVYVTGLPSRPSISLVGLPDDRCTPNPEQQSKLSAVARHVADLAEFDIAVPSLASVWKPEMVVGSPKKRVPSGQRVGRRVVQTGRPPPAAGVGRKRKASELSVDVNVGDDDDIDEAEQRALTDRPVTDLVPRVPPPAIPTNPQPTRPLSGAVSDAATFTDTDVRNARDGKRPEQPSSALTAPGHASNFAFDPKSPRKPQKALTITAQSVCITQRARIAQLVHDPTCSPPRPKRLERRADDAPPPYIRYLPRVEQPQQSRPAIPRLRLPNASASPRAQQLEASAEPNTEADDFDAVTESYTAFLQEQEDDDEDWNAYHARRLKMSWGPYKLKLDDGTVNPILANDVAYNGYSEAEWAWQEERERTEHEEVYGETADPFL